MDTVMVVGEWRGVAFFRDAPVGANRHSRRAYARLGGPEDPPPVGEPDAPRDPVPEPEEEPEEEAARAV